MIYQKESIELNEYKDKIDELKVRYENANSKFDNYLHRFDNQEIQYIWTKYLPLNMDGRHAYKVSQKEIKIFKTSPKVCKNVILNHLFDDNVIQVDFYNSDCQKSTTWFFEQIEHTTYYPIYEISTGRGGIRIRGLGSTDYLNDRIIYEIVLHFGADYSLYKYIYNSENKIEKVITLGATIDHRVFRTVNHFYEYNDNGDLWNIVEDDGEYIMKNGAFT